MLLRLKAYHLGIPIQARVADGDCCFALFLSTKEPLNIECLQKNVLAFTATNNRSFSIFFLTKLFPSKFKSFAKQACVILFSRQKI